MKPITFIDDFGKVRKIGAALLLTLLALPLFCFSNIPEKGMVEEVDKEYLYASRQFEQVFTNNFILRRKADQNSDKFVSIREVFSFLSVEVEDSETSNNDRLMKEVHKANPRIDGEGDDNGVLTREELLNYVFECILARAAFEGRK